MQHRAGKKVHTKASIQSAKTQYYRELFQAGPQWRPQVLPRMCPQF